MPEISPGAYVLIINQALLSGEFGVFGKSIGIRTAYVSLLLSCLTRGVEYLIPLAGTVTGEPLPEVFFQLYFQPSAMYFGARIYPL